MAIHYEKGTYKAVICGQALIETEYGVQLANLREALRDPSRAVFLPEAEAKRLLESD